MTHDYFQFGLWFALSATFFAGITKAVLFFRDMKKEKERIAVNEEMKREQKKRLDLLGTYRITFNRKELGLFEVEKCFLNPINFEPEWTLVKAFDDEQSARDEIRRMREEERRDSVPGEVVWSEA